MKKIISLLLAIAFVFLAIGCEDTPEKIVPGVTQKRYSLVKPMQQLENIIVDLSEYILLDRNNHSGAQYLRSNEAIDTWRWFELVEDEQGPFIVDYIITEDWVWYLRSVKINYAKLGDEELFNHLFGSGGDGYFTWIVDSLEIIHDTPYPRTWTITAFILNEIDDTHIVFHEYIFRRFSRCRHDENGEEIFDVAFEIDRQYYLRYITQQTITNQT